MSERHQSQTQENVNNILKTHILSSVIVTDVAKEFAYFDRTPIQDIGHKFRLEST